MNIAIIYYSFSGNTGQACMFLREKLAGVGHSVTLVEVKPQQEETDFFRQGRMASKHQIPELANGNCSVAPYDLVIFASPVWAFTFTPAVRAFLQACTGLGNKRCACFLTCGAQIASGNALKEFSRAVVDKGGAVFFSTYVTGAKTGDESYLEKRFAGLFKDLK
jgi:flavodoxin